MNRVSSWATLILVTLLTADGQMAGAATPKVLTLAEAIELALEQNKEVQASRENVHVAENELRSSYGKFLPQLNAEGRYTRIDRPLEIDLGPIRTALISSSAGAAGAGAQGAVAAMGGGAAQQAGAATGASTAVRTQLETQLPAFTELVQKNQFGNANLTLVQPLFAGGKIIANLKARKAGLGAAEETDRASRDRIVAEVVGRYFAVQLMNNIVAIRKEVLAGLLEHENHANRLLQEGLLSRANKMRADVAVAEARRELAKVQRELELATILLNNSLGTNEDRFELKTPLFLANRPGSLEELVQQGGQANPQLRTLEYRQDQLGQKVNAGRGNFLPTVSLFGKYEVYQNDLTVLEPKWSVGLLARFNLFNGGSDLFDVKAAASERAALEYLSGNARELVRTEIRKYFHDLDTAREQYQSLETSRALAEENLRLNRISFQEGVATALEIIDAQNALGKVKAEQARALYDADVALAQLCRASGDAKKILKDR